MQTDSYPCEGVCFDAPCKFESRGDSTNTISFLLDKSDCHGDNTPCGFDSFNCKSSCCLLNEGCVIACDDFIKGASPTNVCHYLTDPVVCVIDHLYTSALPSDPEVVAPLTTSVGTTTPTTPTTTPTTPTTPTTFNPFPSIIL